MKALKFCANGCGVPPDPPSLVICKKCKDKITLEFEQMIDDLKKEKEEQELAAVKALKGKQ